MKSNFVVCEKCGKKLIERLPNGLFRFVFGRRNDSPGDPPVYMLIHGNLQIKCFRRTCGHMNTLNYFPFDTNNELDATDHYEEFQRNAIKKHESAVIYREKKKNLPFERTAARAERVDGVCVVCNQKGWWDELTTSYRCNEHRGENIPSCPNNNKK